ncbi:Usp (universal stress protein) family protein [Sugiyamaella lignohabitans]|uniref:Usp (Universal stress protein) family protein n=1 Tax=Sugiyamaella lignohabitans TaxID=796027 RepID=A0A161HGM2_9ASCO|nr:Usp (universal stress protein) family protein [Sugiyamaella lignohabitans]ANB10987.1 Usp (universal stress protein) family protein [Sugiyamaella lignohabitans]
MALEERQYRFEGERFLRQILAKNVNNKKLSLIVEFPVGKIEDMIQRMIQIYEPAILVVGTRGRSMDGFKGLLLPGSVSKYCLQHSPVPVIVVRGIQKLAKRKAKRDADPARRAYREMLYQAQLPAMKLYPQGSTGKQLAPTIPAFLRPDHYGSRSATPSRPSTPAGH